jgi:glycosyltransferase involved in cell wall biosynthesis
VQHQRRILRIALDGDTLGRKRTGDESYLASLMLGLGSADARNEYVVFTRDPEREARRFAVLDGDRWRFRRVGPNSVWLRHPLGLPRALRRERPDVFHAQYFLPPRCRCRCVLTVHDISFAVRPEYFTLRDRVFLGALVPSALRRAARVITDTEYTRADLLSRYRLDPARISVIPLAADARHQPLDRERCRAEIRRRHGFDTPFILFVGTFQPRKNLSTLVRAYGMLRERAALPHKLLVVGKPKYMYEAIHQAIRDTRCEPHVVFAGFVDDADLPTYYNAADVFAFPSLYEGFGLPVVEAMQCGTPVVCSSASCLPEVAADGALLVDPHQPEAFREALERVLTDAAFAENLRERGLRRAAQFSWERTARETLRVYDQAASDS